MGFWICLTEANMIHLHANKVKDWCLSSPLDSNNDFNKIIIKVSVK